ncbi:MAG: response regulator transcription factor [Verrucomicrobiae bacterium]|nr:response regulator transcription factor [Verrucomicrobiae bacterium]
MTGDPASPAPAHSDPHGPRERILVIEDEPSMRTVLHDCLARHGYRVFTASDGERGLTLATDGKPDLILLDLMLPRLDGFALCRHLRRLGFNSPILVLTARSSVQDRVRGLDLGADDYLVKPFSREELLARVRALLRRRAAITAPTRIRFGPVRIDLAARRVWRHDTEVPLAAREFDVLRLLVERAGQVVSRDEFLDRAWGFTLFPTTRTVDKHIVSLRRKLEEDPAQPIWIVTVHGAGYRLTLDPAAAPATATPAVPGPDEAPVGQPPEV